MNHFSHGPYDQERIDDSYRRYFVPGPSGKAGPMTAAYFLDDLFFLILLRRQHPDYRSVWTFPYHAITDRHFAQFFTISRRDRGKA